MDTLSLTTKLSIDDYIKVNYHLLYRKWVIKFATGIGVFMLLVIAFYVNTFTSFPWFQLLFGLFLTIGLPVSVYFSARKNYRSNGRISEVIRYDIAKEYIEVAGESFTSKLTWDKIYSVTENKDWVLIWQSQQIANVVPKRDFKEGELNSFREIVRAQSGIKNKLKQ